MMFDLTVVMSEMGFTFRNQRENRYVISGDQLESLIARAQHEAVEVERERLRAILTTPVADAVILHWFGLALLAPAEKKA